MSKNERRSKIKHILEVGEEVNLEIGDDGASLEMEIGHECYKIELSDMDELLKLMGYTIVRLDQVVP